MRTHEPHPDHVQTTQVLEEDDIRDPISEVPDGDDIMPTFIDRYIEQGRQQGLFTGRKQDRQEGRAEWPLRRMARKFGTLTGSQRRRIEQADGGTPLRWPEPALFAETPEEALR